jgi:hypothetical protein
MNPLRVRVRVRVRSALEERKSQGQVSDDLQLQIVAQLLCSPPV